jgi:hypothetical protein
VLISVKATLLNSPVIPYARRLVEEWEGRGVNNAVSTSIEAHWLSRYCLFITPPVMFTSALSGHSIGS